MMRPSAIDFEPRRLDDFLRARIPDLTGAMTIERISGGQSNPTYGVSFADRRLVLRKRPNGPVLASAHAVDREFRVLDALAKTQVPVPRTVLFHPGEDVVGTPFYLMDRLEGRVFDDAALPGLAPDDRRAIYRGMAEALAMLHAVDPGAIGLGDFGRPGNYFERQIARWSRQWVESPVDDILALDELMDWLPRHLPPDDGRIAIAHGDFRIGNLMFHPTEPRVVGILDWELSTLGHPLADLGFCCMPWHTAPDEYAGILGLDHENLGIPGEAEFVAHYLAHRAALDATSKDAAPNSPPAAFHIAFALFRFAVIFVGIADRVRAGTATGHNAAEVGHLARHFADRALDVARAA